MVGTCSVVANVLIDNTFFPAAPLFWIEHPWLKLFWVDPTLMLPPLNPLLCTPALIMTGSAI